MYVSVNRHAQLIVPATHTSNLFRKCSLLAFQYSIASCLLDLLASLQMAFDEMVTVVFLLNGHETLGGICSRMCDGTISTKMNSQGIASTLHNVYLTDIEAEQVHKKLWKENMVRRSSVLLLF